MSIFPIIAMKLNLGLKSEWTVSVTAKQSVGGPWAEKCTSANNFK